MALIDQIKNKKRWRILNDGDLLKYHRHKYNLKVLKIPHVTKSWGNSAMIYTSKGIAYRYFDDSGENKQNGFHICNMVKRDVTKWLEEHPEFNYHAHMKNYTEQIFNLDKIEKNKGKKMIGIDINSCYFNTIFNIGYITPKTFKLGNKKVEEWKLGRNASVGSLAKIETICAYEKGRRTKKIVIGEGETKDDLLSRKRQAVRHHVIGCVYKMFVELIDDVLKGDFYMFLTDCIYTDEKNLKKVQKFFKEKKYTTKYRHYIINNLNREKRMVSWQDVEKQKEKWYLYASHQLINNAPQIKK